MNCPAPAASLRSVTVSYRGHSALRDVTLDIARGDCCGIIGPNGAGKTTLLTVLNGLTAPSAGTVDVLGVRATGRNFGRLRRRIGYVAQQERVDPRVPVSCFEAVLVGRSGLLRPYAGTDRDRARSMMELTGIAHLAGRPVGQLSGGEARRLALARALAQEPELLLLDEPTANLDPRAVRELGELVVQAWRRFGLTVVMVTHHIAHLPPVTNRILVVKDGRIARAGGPEMLAGPDLAAGRYSDDF